MLEDLVSRVASFTAHDHVVVAGFSAGQHFILICMRYVAERFQRLSSHSAMPATGAYLTLKAMQALDGFPGLAPSVSFIAMGHYLFPDEIVCDCACSMRGVFIFGEREMEPAAHTGWTVGLKLLRLCDASQECNCRVAPPCKLLVA